MWLKHVSDQGLDEDPMRSDHPTKEGLPHHGTTSPKSSSVSYHIEAFRFCLDDLAIYPFGVLIACYIHDSYSNDPGLRGLMPP